MSYYRGGGCIEQYLVYSSSMTTSEAISILYNKNSKNNLEEAALHLRDSIQRCFHNSSNLPWPPAANDLDNILPEKILPSELIKVLSLIITGNEDVEKSEKTKHVILSIAQVCFPLLCS